MVRRRWSVVLERHGAGAARNGLHRPGAGSAIEAGNRLHALVRPSGHRFGGPGRSRYRLRQPRGLQAAPAGQPRRPGAGFIRTSPLRSDPQYSRSIIRPLRRPSADTAAIVLAALAGLRAIYRPGFKLAKAGVMLLELQPAALLQHELDLKPSEASSIGSLMATLHHLNDPYGRGTVALASAGGLMPSYGSVSRRCGRAQSGPPRGSSSKASQRVGWRRSTSLATCSPRCR